MKTRFYVRVNLHRVINKSGPTSFRLRFNLDDDNDKNADILNFYAGEATAANRPTLVVEYILP